jgi:hypothetical protein
MGDLPSKGFLRKNTSNTAVVLCRLVRKYAYAIVIWYLILCACMHMYGLYACVQIYFHTYCVSSMCFGVCLSLSPSDVCAYSHSIVHLPLKHRKRQCLKQSSQTFTHITHSHVCQHGIREIISRHEQRMCSPCTILRCPLKKWHSSKEFDRPHYSRNSSNFQSHSLGSYGNLLPFSIFHSLCSTKQNKKSLQQH